ncbi:hypothetical protein BVC80_8767g11 [Macleaya cordata]|uniref:Disease resistance N-terminal domain-containing protein n=1 Tax=Macleaya cordata TaxID=56857 RepID=A0A200QNC3_MACCD|nr:hypothetical protein BVC80_8767g11 [Macleaya cordata]
MADAVVSVVVQLLSDMLIKQAVFLHGVRDQVKQLRNELNRMQCFLKDADAEQEGNEIIRNWVSEIRDAAYDVEDVIETFILQIEAKEISPNILAKENKMRTTTRGLIKAIFKISFPRSLSKGKKLHGIGKDILAIQERLRDISEKQVLYGIKDLAGEGTSDDELVIYK